MVEKKLPNGQTVTAYPLSSPQMLMLGMSQIYGQGYPVNNISCGYYWKNHLDVDLLRASIMEAVSRCDTMRLGFLPDEQYQMVQFIQEKSSMQVELLDLTDISREEANAKLAEMAKVPVPMGGLNIHEIKIVKFSDGYAGFFMRLHHVAMDAYSVKVFMKDIMEIYLNKLDGRPYPKPMKPYLPALMKEFEYVKSPKIVEDMKYWHDSLANYPEPIFTDYMLDNRLKKQRVEHPEHRFADIHTGSPEEGVIVKDVSEEDTKKIMNMCDEQGLSVCAAVSMGVRTALSIFNDNEEDVSFKMIVNRRATVLEKKSGGIKINYFPMRSIITPDKTFKQAVEEIEAVQNEMYQHCSLNFVKMLEARHESMPKDAKPDSTYDSVGLSYQPLMMVPNFDEETERSSQSFWYNIGATMLPFYLTVRHRANDGGFEFVFEYRKEPDPRYDIEVFFDKIMKSLLKGAEDPQIKVGDILEMYKVTDEERNRA